MSNVVKTFRVFTLFLAGVVFFGSFLAFFSETQLTRRDFFQYSVLGDNFTKSYPPFINNSEDYNNVEETDGSLEVSDTSNSAYFTDVINCNGSISWRTFSYDVDYNFDSPNITLITSDYADFREIKQVSRFSLREGSRVKDISELRDSGYLKWTVDISEDTTKFSLDSVEINGFSREQNDSFNNWLLVTMIILSLIVLVFILGGIIAIYRV